MTRLLIGYDGSESARTAVVVAGALFAGADTTVAYVHAEPVRPDDGSMARLALPSDVLRAGAEAVRSQTLQHAVEGAGDAQALIQAARDAGAIAVLVGTRGLGAVAATVLGSVTSGLVHAGALPVLAVPGTA